MNSVKFTISNGQWTISYEGSEEFLNERLVSSLRTLLESDVFSFTASALNAPHINALDNTTASSGDTKSSSVSIPQMTLNNLCSKLNVKSGPEFIMATCVYMSFMEGKDILQRKEIVQTAKSATRFYKETYISNLSVSLSSLVKQNKLMERTAEVYLLTPEFAREMESQLAK